MDSKKAFPALSFLVSLLLFGSCLSPESTFRNVPWSKDATIYEVNIRQFSEEGTFKAVERALPELAQLGVDILWLMPIHPIGEVNRKGTLGSYYAVKDYFGVNPEYGTEQDFRDLVNAAHANGMRVILDWVANHTAWDNPIATTNPEFFTKDSTGSFTPPIGTDWTDVIQLDFTNPATHDYMMSALAYWVREFDVDGYRCDVAYKVPDEFWNRARKELDAIKPVFMLAEAEEPKFHESAFDMSYSWSVHHMMNKVARGDTSAAAIGGLITDQATRYPAHAYRMQFTSNHDENSWQGTEFERLGDGVRAFAVVSYTIPGMPLIYNGQEYGNPKRLDFFEKDLVQRPDTSFFSFYKTLNELKSTHPALHNGTHGGSFTVIPTSDVTRVFAYIREKDDCQVITIVNLSGDSVMVQIQSDKLTGRFKNVFTGADGEMSRKQEFSLQPWEYVVYTR
jgi:cyclomaltodextrinase